MEQLSLVDAAVKDMVQVRPCHSLSLFEAPSLSLALSLSLSPAPFPSVSSW